MSTTTDEGTMEHLPLLDDVILHENDLTEQAKNLFSYHSDTLRAFESYRQSILHHEVMTRMGRHFTLTDVDKMYKSYKQVLNYVAEHREILDFKLPDFGPLFIVGLPRTGSTLLHNLLACDSDCRAPLYTDMSVEIVPPISRLDPVGQKKRMDALVSSMRMDASFNTQRNKITTAHPAFLIEEDYHILRQAGFFTCFTLVTANQGSKHDTWCDAETKKNYAYDYHEIFLRMLNSVDTPRSHWLLKSPLHSFQLGTILRHYPNAKFIITHRRLDEVLPSLCCLSWTAGEIYIGTGSQTSQHLLTKNSIQFINKAIECIMEFCTNQNHMVDRPQTNIFDVNYNDLMKDPIATVRRIYDHFGLRWSNEFEMAMLDWLRDNPQGKQGRHIYSLADCGLTREDIETRYADYIKFFRCSPSYETDNDNSDRRSSANEELKQA